MTSISKNKTWKSTIFTPNPLKINLLIIILVRQSLVCLKRNFFFLNCLQMYNVDYQIYLDTSIDKKKWFSYKINNAWMIRSHTKRKFNVKYFLSLEPHLHCQSLKRTNKFLTLSLRVVWISNKFNTFKFNILTRIIVYERNKIQLSISSLFERSSKIQIS